MCSGAELMAYGNLAGGVSEMAYRNVQAAQMRSDAAGERDSATQQAQRILRETERRRGAARAATAASGAAVDQFALRNEQDIQAAGENDAAMTILSGERSARVQESGARMQRAAGLNAMGSSLFRGAEAFKNWRGAYNFDEDGMLYSRTGADIRARR